jgi:hypothetical protein
MRYAGKDVKVSLVTKKDLTGWMAESSIQN